MLLTEEQIERKVELQFDLLDLKLIGGAITQAEYDARCRAIGEWAEREYQTARKPQD